MQAIGHNSLVSSFSYINIAYISDEQSAARGPHAALGFILCGPLTAIKNIHCAALSEILRHFKISNLSFMQIFLQLLIICSLREQTIFDEAQIVQKKAYVVSLKVAWTLCKHKKPFSDVDVIKECFSEMTSTLFSDNKKM